MRLSPAMLEVLLNAAFDRDLFHGCRGQSQFGGRTQTIRALKDRGLLTERGNITVEGCKVARRYLRGERDRAVQSALKAIEDAKAVEGESITGGGAENPTKSLVTKHGVRVELGQCWRDCDKRSQGRKCYVAEIDYEREKVRMAPSRDSKRGSWVSVRRMYRHSTGWELVG